MRAIRSQTFSPLSLALLATALLLTVTPSLSAQAAKAKPAAAKTNKPLTWGPAPAVFPAGARMAVVSGDPTKSGPFAIRLSMPANYRIPPHFHPTAEHVSVRSGALYVGMGDKLDVAKAHRMAPGDTGTIAANMHHYAATKGRTVVNVTADGPFAMTYVNPADAPKKQ